MLHNKKRAKEFWTATKVLTGKPYKPFCNPSTRDSTSWLAEKLGKVGDPFLADIDEGIKHEGVFIDMGPV